VEEKWLCLSTRQRGNPGLLLSAVAILGKGGSLMMRHQAIHQNTRKGTKRPGLSYFLRIRGSLFLR
jgi:hypothetical protein